MAASLMLWARTTDFALIQKKLGGDYAKTFRFLNLFVVTGYLIITPAMSYASPFLPFLI
jgi:hypothetical protein